MLFSSWNFSQKKNLRKDGYVIEECLIILKIQYFLIPKVYNFQKQITEDKCNFITFILMQKLALIQKRWLSNALNKWIGLGDKNKYHSNPWILYLFLRLFHVSLCFKYIFLFILISLITELHYHDKNWCVNNYEEHKLLSLLYLVYFSLSFCLCI